MQGGAGNTEGENGWAYKVRPPFFKFLLFTDYPLQLPHLPNMKNVTHSCVFRVQSLSCPSPCLQQPSTKNVPMWACSLCWAAFLPSPALSPSPGHKKHVHLMCFSCSVALIPQPSSPTRKLCPQGHGFCARALLWLPPCPHLPPHYPHVQRYPCPLLPFPAAQQKDLPMWAHSSCSAAPPSTAL